MPSFRNNLAARLVSDTYSLATSLIAATITARVLGPSGRGYYASLVLLSVIFVQMFNAGLGEAAVVLAGRGRTSLQAAVSATVSLVIPLSIAGGVVFVGTGALVLHAGSLNAQVALVVGGVLVMCNTFATTIAWFLVSREKLVSLAIFTIGSVTTTTVGLYALVALVHLQTSGAMLAALLGCVVMLVPLLRVLTRSGISFRPAWDGNYLRSAVRFGAALQVSNLLVQMTARLDLIFVYRISGSSAAGLYSIALTVGALVGSIPIAIAFASFPRLPRLTDDEAPGVIAGLFRTGVAAAILCALLLGGLSPFLLPFAFGPAYRSAIEPTLILIPAGVLWSAQWILSRAMASRGVSRPLVFSFSASFALMVALDLILISPFGISG
ncbi:MAG: oligosaccharide flippase family protein, partial [Actinomycetota bacterium]|nr:oligosaccharide flippase family protein [Actinomycetota bacterium]